MLSLALDYARQGWPVFPCNPNNKRPLIDRGFHAATLDEGVINAWWTDHPTAMVGIPTGPRVGFWVLDIDTDKTKGKDGIGSLASIDHDLAELQDTVVSRTGSGGYHCLFKYQDGVTNSRGSLPPFLDVRGDGGYIIAPGSRLADGRTYEWLNPPNEIDIAPAPDWVLELLKAPTKSAEIIPINGVERGPNAAQRALEILPGQWHDTTRDLVARMCREGASDATIAAIAPRFTEGGFTHEQTILEFMAHARTARTKWGYQPKDLAAEVEQEVVYEDGEKPKFKFNVTFYDDIPETHTKEWVIRDILGEGEFNIVYGAPGCGKSVLIGDAAAHVAAGLDWFGKKTRQCCVIYIAAERHALVKRRLAAWRKKHGVLDLPLVVLDGLFNLTTDPTHVDEIIAIAKYAAMKTGLNVGWFIVDTKAQVMGGADENSSQDISMLSASVAKLQTTGASVTVVDHTPQSDPTRMKGNGGLAGTCDGSFLIQKQGDRRTLTIGSKLPNDGPDDVSLSFRLDGIVLGINADGEKTTAPVVIPVDEGEPVQAPTPNRGLGKNQQLVFDAISLAARSGQMLGFSRLKVMSGIQDNGTFGRCVRDLIKAALIEEIDAGGSKLFKLP